MARLFVRLKTWLVTRLPTTKTVAGNIEQTGAIDLNEHEHVQNVVPYDENLLERSRTQWQFGDRESLVKLERNTHPRPSSFRFSRKLKGFAQGAVRP